MDNKIYWFRSSTIYQNNKCFLKSMGYSLLERERSAERDMGMGEILGYRVRPQLMAPCKI